MARYRLTSVPLEQFNSSVRQLNAALARVQAAEAENDRLRGELARVERETIERAAGTAETRAIIVPLTPGTACGASSTKRQVAAAIRALEPRHD